MEKQTQELERKAYELLEKARESQGLPLQGTSTLKYKSFYDLIYADPKESRLRNNRIREHDNSGYREKCFVEQRWLMTLPERDFKITNAYFKNDTGLIGNPVYEKLTSDRPPVGMRQDGCWAVEGYFIGKLRARTLTEEEYHFVLNTPIREVYAQTLNKFKEMEDFPLEAKLKLCKDVPLTISPLTLRLANLKTLQSLKDWIVKDEKYWEEKRPLLEAELEKIKGLQNLNFDSAERQKYKDPWSTRYKRNDFSGFDIQLMNWGNHEIAYVRGRWKVEQDISSLSGKEEVSRIPRSPFDYFQDPVYNRLCNLQLYVDQNTHLKGARAIKRFAENSIDLIKRRKMKERDYNAILGVTKSEEFLDLAMRKGRKIRTKQKGISRKPIYISPLTLRLLRLQMDNFVENRGYFHDRSERDCFLEDTLE